MTTKVCTNSKCPAYAHFVYSVEMRCVHCKWDLKAAQRSREGAGMGGAVVSAASKKAGGTHVVS